MEIPFENVERSEWKARSRLQFFKKTKTLFKTLEQDEKIEIMLRLGDDDPEYFEIPIYDKDNDDIPSVIVVFEDERIFVDFLQPSKKKYYLSKIKSLAGESAQIINCRLMNEEDWTKRLLVFNSILENWD